jgi:acetolactate synthase-1/2/3 large subunit
VSATPSHGGFGPVTPPLPRRRVIVVDDDPAVLRSIGRRLRDRPEIELILVDNGIDALIRIGAARPDLVIMDVYMPGLDGVEACRRLKANPETRDIKVVLASGAMTSELEASARDAGAARGVAKPIDVPTLLEEAWPAATAGAPVAAKPTADTLRAADVLVAMLADAGVDVVFGLPGGPISPIHDALLDSSIRVITTRHESGAMFAAAGYAHATGKLGVVAVTSGPGVLNAMTGLASAWCDGLPVLLLVGEVPRRAQGKGVLQDGSALGLRVVEMTAPITKLAAEIPTATQLPHLVRRAIETAMSGKRGPVVLTLPLDVTTARIERPRVGGSVTFESAVPPEMLDEVAGLLTRARRPLMLVGSGVRGGTAPERLRTIVERIGCPVATTPKAKGVFPENHPLALGVLGLGGHPSARAYLEAGVDVVAAIGTSLGDLATDGFDPLLQARAFIQVDIDSRLIGRSYAPTHAVVATAADFLGGLAERMPVTPSTQLRTGVPSAGGRLAGGVIRHPLQGSRSTGLIAPHHALAEIQSVLPANTIFTVDSGEHFLFAAHYLEINHPDAFIVMTGLGSMGQSIGAAIGARLAHPDRVVAAICGDGCFAMNAFEVATAVAERLPIRVFVFNDQRLGMVEIGHQAVYGRHPAYPTTPMDVCVLASGLGAASLRIDRRGQLAAAADLIRAAPGPLVIDVRIDHEIRMPKKDRVAAWKQDGPEPPKPRPDGRPPQLRLVN